MTTKTDPRLPQAIEIRTGGVKRRHLLDWDAAPFPECTTTEAFLFMAARWIESLRAKLLEDAILEGHNRIEVQVEGQPTTAHTVPSWRRHPWARWQVERARRRHRRERWTSAPESCEGSPQGPPTPVPGPADPPDHGKPRRWGR